MLIAKNDLGKLALNEEKGGTATVTIADVTSSTTSATDPRRPGRHQKPKACPTRIDSALGRSIFELDGEDCP